MIKEIKCTCPVYFLVLGMYIGWRLASLVLPMGKYLPLRAIAMLGCGMLGLLVFVLAGHFLILGRTRLAVYRVLTNLDEAICPTCGYDLKGHVRDAIDHEIRCPECGKMVPRLSPSDESHDQ